MKPFEARLPHLLSPIAIECLKDTEGAIRLIGKIPFLSVRIRILCLTIVCPFTEEVSEPVQRLRAVRWRVIRFFRDCEDVPILLGLFFCVFVISTIWLLLGYSFGFQSWDWSTSLDFLVPPQSFSAADFENEIPQLAAT